LALGDWAQAAAQIFSSYEKGKVDIGAPKRVVVQLGQWFGHLAKNAAIKWTPALAESASCSFCDEDAVTNCIVCGDPCCIAHAHISHRAEAICDECVEKAVQKSGKKKKKSRREPRNSQGDLSIRQAYAVLGLSTNASWQEIQEAYKYMAVANHPDRFTGPKKAQAELKLKEINIAFNLIKSSSVR